MEEYQQRVVDEKAELDEKAGKLQSFIGSEHFQSLDESECGRLRIQLQCMFAYSSVLNERIINF